MNSKPKLITKLGRERMHAMIAYLRALEPKFFDFGEVALEDGCGTVGCVIGHTPAVFPSLCSYLKQEDDDGYMSVCVNGQCGSYDEIGAAVFGLNIRTANALFTPGMQCGVFGTEIPECGRLATPAEVADMLESFLSQVDDAD